MDMRILVSSIEQRLSEGASFTTHYIQPKKTEGKGKKPVRQSG